MYFFILVALTLEKFLKSIGLGYFEPIDKNIKKKIEGTLYNVILICKIKILNLIFIIENKSFSIYTAIQTLSGYDQSITQNKRSVENAILSIFPAVDDEKPLIIGRVQQMISHFLRTEADEIKKGKFEFF